MVPDKGGGGCCRRACTKLVSVSAFPKFSYYPRDLHRLGGMIATVSEGSPPVKLGTRCAFRSSRGNSPLCQLGWGRFGSTRSGGVPWLPSVGGGLVPSAVVFSCPSTGRLGSWLERDTVKGQRERGTIHPLLATIKGVVDDGYGAEGRENGKRVRS